jgi:hypothetical protein
VNVWEPRPQMDDNESSPKECFYEEIIDEECLFPYTHDL